MNKSVVRLAHQANANGGPPPSKKHCASDDSCEKDAKPKIKKINEVLAVEILEIIVLFVPTKSTGNLWLQEELSEITITRRFQLRNLCRLWRSIVYRNTKLTVVLTCADGSETRKISILPAGFKFEQAAGLFEALTCSAGQSATLDGASWIELIMRVCLNWNGEKNDESTISVLTRVTKSIRHPVDLELALPTANMIGTIKHNFRIPFVTRFPNTALAKLDLWSACHSGIFIRKEFIYSACLTNFYLKAPSNHLTELHVGLFALDKALTGFDDRRDRVLETEPWTCNSLRRLKLWIAPLDTEHYDGDNVETRNAAFAIQAKLPVWFPQLKQLLLDWSFNRFQFDFTVLQNFAVLDDLALLSDFSRFLMRQDCRLIGLPNIKIFAFSAFNAFPMDLTDFVPSLCKLKIRCLERHSCRDLARQFHANAGSLQHLCEISLDFSQREREISWYATQDDFRDLLSTLECAQQLVELELKNVCPPDGLSLFNNIPKGVVRLILDCCLMPDWVGYDRNYETWFVCAKRNTLLELNETYKFWIRDLLCRLADFSSLKEFCCVVPTPNFKTARHLVAQWQRDVSKLVADLNVILTALTLQSIDFDPVDNSAKSLGLTAKLLASGDSSESARRIVARIVFKDADYVTY